MPIIKDFSKPKKNLMVVEVGGFYNKKFFKLDCNHTCLAVVNLGSTLKKEENYCLQVFLKVCIYIENKVNRHINDNLSGFSSSDQSGE